MAGPLDDLVAAGVRSWLSVAQAWIDAANDIVIAWLDLADVESGGRSFNEEAVTVPAQRTPIDLHPRGFTDWDQNELPPTALTIEPAQVDGGAVTKVRVVVVPPDGTPSGTYTGSLHDPAGTRVVEEVGVYVVGDRLPP